MAWCFQMHFAQCWVVDHWKNCSWAATWSGSDISYWSSALKASKKDRGFTFHKSKTSLNLGSLQRLKCIQEAFMLSCLWLISTFFPLSLCVLLSQTPGPARLPFWWKKCRYRVTPKSQCPYPLVTEEETSFWVYVNHASMSLAKSIITTITTAFVAVPFVYLWIRLCSEVGDVRLDASSAHWHQDQ